MSWTMAAGTWRCMTDRVSARTPDIDTRLLGVDRDARAWRG